MKLPLDMVSKYVFLYSASLTNTLSRGTQSISILLITIYVSEAKKSNTNYYNKGTFN